MVALERTLRVGDRLAKLRSLNSRNAVNTLFGEVAEWLKAHAWKACIR